MEEINLLDYLHIISRRRKAVAAITASVVILALLFVLVVPAKYESSALLIFPKKETSGGNLLAQLSGVQTMLLGNQSSAEPSFYSQILQSRRLTRALYENLEMQRFGLEIEDLEEYVKVELPRDGGLKITCTASSKWFGNQKKADANRNAAKLAAEMANTLVKELQSYDQASSFKTGRRNLLSRSVKRTLRSSLRIC
jgi:capsular polysaccharide biosynthesis protein